mgnify:CR=1 FL=1
MFPDFDAGTDRVGSEGAPAASPCSARTRAGEFAYFCSLPGHRPAGMERQARRWDGQGAGGRAAPVGERRAQPVDLPGPVPAGPPRTFQVELEAVELVGRLGERDDLQLLDVQRQGAGPIPPRARRRHGRARPSRTATDSRMIHSVDFHAATGPGGGAVATQTPPGETKSLRFQALNPGAATSITAPRPWWRTTSRAGCTGSSSWSRRAGCRRSTASSTSCRASSTPTGPSGSRARRVQRREAARASGPSTSSSTARWARSRPSTR